VAYRSVTVDHLRLRRVIMALLRRAGSSAREAKACADHLVEANLKGHDSHGVGMIPAYVNNLLGGRLNLNQHIRVVKDGGSTAVVDGRLGIGQVVAMEATELAIARARKHGVAVVALRNAHHIGRVGTYGERCAAAGLVSLHFVNVLDHDPWVAPFRGAEARFGTNPICIAMPGGKGEHPIVLDFATSRVALGKVRVAKQRGKPVADGLVIDAKGRPTNDPNVMWANPHGSLVAFGEHKGYGLSLIAELFAGALGGAGSIAPKNPRRGSIINGMLTVAIDPRRLGNPKAIVAERRAVIAYTKSARAAKRGLPVLVAGEPERIARAARIRAGIPIELATWTDILAAGTAVGLPRAEALRIAGV